MKTIKQAYKEEIGYIEGRKSGNIKSMYTPWPKVNQAGIDGLEWGTISTIASMSGVGKTTVANQIITEVDDLNPNQSISVLFFTMEMAARRLVGRSISNEMGRTVKSLYTECSDDDLKHIKENIFPKYIKKDITYIEFPRTPKQTRHQIEIFIKNKLNKQHLIVYDHSLLVRREPGYTERDSLIQLLSEFNELKKIYPNSQYILLSQLNREIESHVRINDRYAHYPKKGDIFGSESCYQFSDIVLVLHDPSKLGIMSYGPNKLRTRGYLFGHILKARDANSNLIIVFKNNLKNNKITEMTQSELINNQFIKP